MSLIVVHHLENSRSHRILWALEELELPYTVRRYSRDKKTLLAPTELRQLHPLGKSPMLELDGKVLAETAAILEFLIELSGGKLGPPSSQDDFLQYRFFLHYAEGSIMPPLLVKLVLDRLPLLGRIAARKFQPMIDRHLDFVELHLAENDWFAGENISAADIMMSFPLEAARARAGLDERRPHSLAFLDKVQSRSAYRQALQNGGPYAYASAY